MRSTQMQARKRLSDPSQKRPVKRSRAMSAALINLNAKIEESNSQEEKNILCLLKIALDPDDKISLRNSKKNENENATVDDVRKKIARLAFYLMENKNYITSRSQSNQEGANVNDFNVINNNIAAALGQLSSFRRQQLGITDGQIENKTLTWVRIGNYQLEKNVLDKSKLVKVAAAETENEIRAILNDYLGVTKTSAAQLGSSDTGAPVVSNGESERSEQPPETSLEEIIVGALNCLEGLKNQTLVQDSIDVSEKIELNNQVNETVNNSSVQASENENIQPDNTEASVNSDDELIKLIESEQPANVIEASAVRSNLSFFPTGLSNNDQQIVSATDFNPVTGQANLLKEAIRRARSPSDMGKKIDKLKR